MKSGSRKRGWIVIIAIVIVVIDCFFIKSLIPQIESRSYPSTTGWIISSKVREMGGPDAPCYGVSFKYRYQVNGHSYEETRFRYAYYAGSLSWARNLAASHPAGSQIQVFYNPQNPADSLLSAGINAEDIIFSLFFTSVTIFIFYLWWRFV
jgi:Protein of unknown function (DUF3592)